MMLTPYTKRLLSTLSKLIVTGALFLWMAQKVELRTVLASLAALSPAVLLICFVLVMLTSTLQTVRWRLIAARIDKAWAFIPAFKIILMGIFFSQFLPTSIGGDVIRVWHHNRAGMPLAKAFHSVLLDRLAAVFALAIIVLSGLPFLVQRMPVPFATAIEIIGAAAILSGIAGLYLLHRYDGIVRLRRYKGVNKLAGLLADMLSVASHPRDAFLIAMLSIVMQLLIGTVMWLLARNMGADVSWFACAVLVPMVILVSMLPVSVAGWGIREGSMVVAFGLMHVPASLAVSISISFGLILLASGIPGCIVWWLHKHHHPAPLAPPSPETRP